MKKTAFYSWESDLPNRTNRSLIEEALRAAAREIAADDAIKIDPVIDRDTQGVAGSPDITTTIFSKISAADVFVADVSVVHKGRRRSFPNPNVLVELGYALGELGSEQVILVFNEAYGKKEKLPFDLRSRRMIGYIARDDGSDLSAVKKELIRELRGALLAGFKASVPEAGPTVNILDVVKNNLPSKKIAIREHLASLTAELDTAAPVMHRDGGTAENLIDALPRTENLVNHFAELAEVVVLMDDMIVAREIFQWFGFVLDRYEPAPNANNRISNADGDFFKFLGHELFVSFVSPFIREGKWTELRDILKGSLRLPSQPGRPDRRRNWTDLSACTPSLTDESKKRGRMSLHADLLRDRHENASMAAIPLTSFVDADFFLYLHGGDGRIRGDEFYSQWYPQSILWQMKTPNFIFDAEDYPTAVSIASAAGTDLDDFKARVKASFRLEHARHHTPITTKEVENMGSKGGAIIVDMGDE